MTLEVFSDFLLSFTLNIHFKHNQHFLNIIIENDYVF